MRFLLLILIATSACVTPAQVAEPRSVPQRTIELRSLCTSSEYRSMCMPASEAAPIKIDTNLATPRVASTPTFG